MQKIIIRKKTSPAFQLTKDQSIYYFANDLPSTKLALFDLDGTIIETLSGQKFAQSSADWRWLYDCVPSRLQKYHENGYKIIIISNQAGLSTGQTTLNYLTEKLAGIATALKIPFEFYCSTMKDHFRKPMTDIWDFVLLKNHFKDTDVSPLSFYCGDAAGREKNYIPGKSKDFNITDRYFAHNIKHLFCTPEDVFCTPEEVFLDLQPFKHKDPYQTDLNLDQYAPTMPLTLFPPGQNMIILVGAQASGKSRLTQHPFYHDYLSLNNDTIKSMTKLKKMYAEALQKGQNIIIDNTNPSANSRQDYIKLATMKGYNIYCYFFDFPKLFSIHLNQMRVQMTHGARPLIPMVAIHTYYKQLVKPTLSEGFKEIITIDRLPLADNDILPLSPNDEQEQFNRYYYYHYDLLGR